MVCTVQYLYSICDDDELMFLQGGAPLKQAEVTINFYYQFYSRFYEQPLIMGSIS